MSVESLTHPPPRIQAQTPYCQELSSPHESFKNNPLSMGLDQGTRQCYSLKRGLRGEEGNEERLDSVISLKRGLRKKENFLL